MKISDFAKDVESDLPLAAGIADIFAILIQVFEALGPILEQCGEQKAIRMAQRASTRPKGVTGRRTRKMLSIEFRKKMIAEDYDNFAELAIERAIDRCADLSTGQLGDMIRES